MWKLMFGRRYNTSVKKDNGNSETFFNCCCYFHYATYFVWNAEREREKRKKKKKMSRPGKGLNVKCSVPMLRVSSDCRLLLWGKHKDEDPTEQELVLNSNQELLLLNVNCLSCLEMLLDLTTSCRQIVYLPCFMFNARAVRSTFFNISIHCSSVNILISVHYALAKNRLLFSNCQSMEINARLHLRRHSGRKRDPHIIPSYIRTTVSLVIPQLARNRMHV